MVLWPLGLGIGDISATFQELWMSGGPKVGSQGQVYMYECHGYTLFGEHGSM